MLLCSATVHAGTISGFNLGDELVWNCLAPANLTIAANAVRARYPRGAALIWYNEATPPLQSDFDSCGNTHLGYTIPNALDLFRYRAAAAGLGVWRCKHGWLHVCEGAARGALAAM
jgi:hypothetical protein